MFYKTARPEKYIGDYLLSKTIRSSRKCFHLDSPESNLVRERNEFFSTEQMLELKREDYKKKRKIFDEQWQSINTEGSEFKRNFYKFNKFMIENVEKRKRAEELTKQFKTVIEKKNKTISELRINVTALRNMLQDLEKEVARHILYEKFLCTVLDVAAQEERFKNIEDIINRFEHYSELGSEFANKLAAKVMALENAKADLGKCYNNNQDKILVLYGKIAGFQGRYEEAIRKTRHLELLISRIKDKSLQNFVDLTFTKSAIWNLYSFTCRRQPKGYKIKKDDFENQLLFINRTIQQTEDLKQKLETSMRKKSLKKAKK